MAIAAFDVHYLEDGRASAACVLFYDYRDPEPSAVYTLFVPRATDYIPGDFYRREIPCILALVKQMTEPVDEMVVDGYVTLGNRPGLGQHLFESFDGKISVIGVAKSKLKTPRGKPRGIFTARNTTNFIYGRKPRRDSTELVEVKQRGMRSLKRFKGSFGAEVFRRGSIRPLYVTSAGVDQKKAAERIRMMHGDHRVPTLLKRVDLLARENAQQNA
jgi:deoxyribonuclease V